MNILKNEIDADTTQLFNPVKNADQNIFIHCTIYHIAYNLIALVVNANNSASQLTNILASNHENISDVNVSTIAAIHKIFKLLNNTFLSSSWFFAQ